MIEHDEEEPVVLTHVLDEPVVFQHVAEEQESDSLFDFVKSVVTSVEDVVEP